LLQIADLMNEQKKRLLDGTWRVAKNFFRDTDSEPEVIIMRVHCGKVVENFNSMAEVT
jgi:hypothetical protein